MESNLSVGKILLMAYVIISSSYCSNLFSNALKVELETNKYMQHLILILLIMSLLIIFDNPFGVQISPNHTFNMIILTLLVYVWFILTTKLDLAWNIGVILLLIIYFLYESKLTSNINLKLSDSNVSDENKKKIVSEFVKTNNYVLMILFGFTLMGTFLYSNEKQIQYGGGFNLANFWFG